VVETIDDIAEQTNLLALNAHTGSIRPFQTSPQTAFRELATR
jgi:hypothetical protein